MPGDDSTLTKIAVFGITVSIMATCLVALLGSEFRTDYDYDTIRAYQDDLISFSGDTMVNSNPWVLVGVYTPYIDGPVQEHLDPDGWLYNTSIQYPDLGRSAGIRLDPAQKSNVKISTGEDRDYSYVSGIKYNSPQYAALAHGWNVSIGAFLSDHLGWDSKIDAYTYTSGIARTWNYTGYRYVFEPVLPFFSDASSKDGALSVVWYSYGGQEGLSGGLDIYGGDVKLGSYAASDIVAAYNTASGFASTYDFDFEGTHLQLSVKFDDPYAQNLMSEFSAGRWTMAVSSVSAGNFYDVENSMSFFTTAGNVLDTFIDIYTFQYPTYNDSPWFNMILWLIVGLPMTLAGLFIALRMVGSFIKVI